jgi:atypical dual specificity phosphatase
MNYLNFSWIIKGKLAGHSAPSSGKDLEWLAQQGIAALVRLTESKYTKATQQQVQEYGMIDLQEPVPDFSAPTLDQIIRAVGFIEQSISSDQPVAVSCGAGYGRTGTVLACYLVSQCYSADAAIKEIRSQRPGSIETKDQENVIREYAAFLNK